MQTSASTTFAAAWTTPAGRSPHATATASGKNGGEDFMLGSPETPSPRIRGVGVGDERPRRGTGGRICKMGAMHPFRSTGRKRATLSGGADRDVSKVRKEVLLFTRSRPIGKVGQAAPQ